ncbi:MAG: hypothetical protein OEZ58_23730 [Gammaproteobacteria bacterium]|nr:hypothetical protein [Gammaproteobacteria bacterium]
MRQKSLAQKRYSALFNAVFGSSRLKVILGASILLGTFSWAADSSLHVMMAVLKNLSISDPKQTGAQVNWQALFLVIPFLFSLMSVWLFMKKRSKLVRPTIVTNQNTPKIKGLILYLSTISDTQLNEFDRILTSSSIEELGDKFSWRMPLEAIRYHEETLLNLIVICSSGGSQSVKQQFSDLVKHFFPKAQFELQFLDDVWYRYKHGVDFSDVEAVFEATRCAFDWLSEESPKSLPEHEILIDITGGMKTNGIAGVMVSFAEGRYVQYVSNDYQVVSYDINYEPSD